MMATNLSISLCFQISPEPLSIVRILKGNHSIKDFPNIEDILLV